MQFSISTEKLQNLVARSIKGASNNKMLPLTNLMCIEEKDNKLTLTTTDGSNYLYIKTDNVGEDFYVVAPVDIFSKLIARLTCDTVNMEVINDALVVSGNGRYTIELPIDEDGSLVKYPNPASFDFSIMDSESIDLPTIKMMLSTARCALSASMKIPCYTGYFVGEKIITTDTRKICGINTKVFNTNALLNPSMVDLLDNMTAEKITVYRHSNVIIFDTPDCTVFGKLMDSIDDYQIIPITALLDDVYTNSCKIYRNELLQLLDRLALFVSPYDKNAIVLSFGRDGLLVTSKRDNSSEVIPYYSVNNQNEFSCEIDIEDLRSQIKANIGDMIEIHYGKPNAIKLVDGTITQIVALFEE